VTIDETVDRYSITGEGCTSHMTDHQSGGVVSDVGLWGGVDQTRLLLRCRDFRQPKIDIIYREEEMDLKCRGLK